MTTIVRTLEANAPAKGSGDAGGVRAEMSVSSGMKIAIWIVMTLMMKMNVTSMKSADGVIAEINACLTVMKLNGKGSVIELMITGGVTVEMNVFLISSRSNNPSTLVGSTTKTYIN